MADNIAITPGSGASVAADELTDGTLGSVKVQYVKMMDGTLDSSNKLVIDSSGRLTTTIPTGAGKTLLFGSISTASLGDTTLVAAAGVGIKIKIVSYTLVVAGTVNITFKSGASSITGAMPLVANSGVSANGAPFAHLLETATNNAFIINLSAAVQASGHFAYFTE